MRVAVAALLVALVGQVYAECENGLDVTGCYKGKWSYESTPITTTCTEDIGLGEMTTGDPWCMLPAYQVSWGGASPMQCFLLGAPASGLTCLSALCDAAKCMENWSYYSYGGSLIKANISRTTRVDSGGRENEQPW